MNFVIIFICSNIVLVDSRGPDYSPLNTVVSNLKKSYGAAQKLISSNTLVPKTYNYYGYSNYISLNDYAYDYVSTVLYTTNLFAKIFGNFSAASIDTSADYKMKLGMIQNMAHYALDLDLSVYLEGLPTYIQEGYIEILNDFANELNNLIDFLTSSINNIDQLVDANLTINTANLLKYLPSPTIIGIWLNRIADISNIYYGLINNITQDFSAIYTLFKSSDPTFLAIEKHKNATIINIWADINQTKLFIRDSVLNFTNDLNSTFKNYFSMLPKSLNISANNVDQFMQQATKTLKSMSGSFDNLLDAYKNQTLFNSGILEKYYNNLINQTISPRSLIFYNFMNSETKSSCPNQMLTEAEATFKAFGSQSAIFNCTNVEKAIFIRIKSVFNAFLANFKSEMDSYFTNLQKCPKLPIISSNMSSNSFSYSMQSCIETNIAPLMSFTPAIQAESNDLLQMVSKYIPVSTDRLRNCLKDTTNHILSIFGEIYMKYSNC